MKVLLSFCFLALLGCTLAQINVPGPCRDIAVQEYFDVHAYQGVWYELKRYENVAERDFDCVTADYNINDEEGGLDVVNGAVDLITANHWFASGRAFVAFPDEWPLRGLLNVTFSDEEPADHINYRVVETDYENYALVWNCVDLDDGTANEYAWVMARAYEVTGDQQGRVDELVAQHLDESQLRVTLQDQEICLGGEGPAPAF